MVLNGCYSLGRASHCRGILPSISLGRRQGYSPVTCPGRCQVSRRLSPMLLSQPTLAWVFNGCFSLCKISPVGCLSLCRIFSRQPVQVATRVSPVNLSRLLPGKPASFSDVASQPLGITSICPGPRLSLMLPSQRFHFGFKWLLFSRQGISRQPVQVVAR